ncbi:MAG TPA: hypothetical protein VMD59_01300 [Acidimicrobiales bacterium]|nr:hypothetical protein [Acidimicrobiales bacterium]
MAVGLTLDSGVLVAFERGRRRAVALVARARERGEPLSIPAGVLCARARARTRARARIATSDPDDIRRLDRSLELVTV